MCEVLGFLPSTTEKKTEEKLPGHSRSLQYRPLGMWILKPCVACLWHSWKKRLRDSSGRSCGGGGEESRKSPWVTLMRWCFSLLRPQCGVCKTLNPCITVGAWAFSKEKCHNFN